jgi:hypothetical protein
MLFKTRNHFSLLVAAVLLLSLSGCFRYKSLAQHFLDGEELAYRATKKMSKEYFKATESDQLVYLSAEHDYFQARSRNSVMSKYVDKLKSDSNYVKIGLNSKKPGPRILNGYMLGTKVDSSADCAQPITLAELGFLGIGWQADSVNQVEVNGQYVIGKTVPFKCFVGKQQVLDTVIQIPNHLAPHIADTLSVKDTLKWIPSGNDKDVVLLVLRSDSSEREYIIKDKGYTLISKKMLKAFGDFNRINAFIYRAKSYSFDRDDQENRTVGLLYLERADWVLKFEP